ncbi:MAG: aminotransferase class I/II-fold pyridoxal phosphate-dependent enzyme [Thermoflexales bacterium]
MRIANRIKNLGTEKAFAVSQAAREWAALGNSVYPFHLGDINLPTPANIVAAQQRAIAEGKTGYCAPAGIPELRAALADDVGARRGLKYQPENVAVQPGGKPVITKFIQALINPGDEVLYPAPGFPIYESQIDYFGAVAKPYRYAETDRGFAIDLDFLSAQITPRTRALIFNNQQNPLAAEATDAELERLAELAIQHDLWVLADEAYFETRYSGQSRSIVAVPGMQDRSVILYTFSKKFAMTGWRLGAAIAPVNVAEIFGRLNVNDESCTAHFAQWAGVEAVRGDPSGPLAIRDELRRRRDVLYDAVQAMPGLRAARPEAAFYLYVNVAEAMAARSFTDVNAFASAALRGSGVAFCTRRHFGRLMPGEPDHFVRFAYSGIGGEDIRAGMSRFHAWIEGADNPE